MLVCSPGGHLAQLERLLEAFDGHELSLVTYRSPRGPRPIPSVSNTYLVPYIGTNPIRLLGAMPTFLRALYRQRPQVLVSTGSEIAIALFFIAKLVGMKTLYIESLSRVRSRSGTGRIVYHLADRFFVQWEPLLEHYWPKAEFRGRVV